MEIGVTDYPWEDVFRNLGGGSRFRVPRFYYAPLKFYLATKKGTWEQHPANLIPPLTTKHASALSVDGTPSLARCRDFDFKMSGIKEKGELRVQHPTSEMRCTSHWRECDK